MTRTSAKNARTPRWAIISGLIRDEAVFQHQLDHMLRHKAAGDIDDIVVSTWFGELERYPSVREAYERDEFVLVQAEPPLLKTAGYTVHQAKTLYNALQVVPEGAMCLKIRPDIAPVTDAVMAAVLTVDLTLTAQKGWPKVFKQKILTAGYFVDSPYYINDIIFYGQREDLLKLATFDLSTEMVLANTAAEQFFFRGALANLCPLIEAYLKIYPAFPFGDPGVGQARMQALLGSDFFLDVVATSTRLMRHYFRVGFVHEEGRAGHAPLEAGFDLDDLFIPKTPTPGVSFNEQASSSTVVEERAMSAILEGRFKKDALGERMMAALARTEDPSYWQTFNDNMFRPDPAVVALEQSLRAVYQETNFAYEVRLAVQNDERGRNFSVAGPQDRLGLTVKTDETRRLEEEINHMRRQVDALLARDAASAA